MLPFSGTLEFPCFVSFVRAQIPNHFPICGIRYGYVDLDLENHGHTPVLGANSKAARYAAAFARAVCRSRAFRNTSVRARSEGGFCPVMSSRSSTTFGSKRPPL